MLTRALPLLLVAAIFRAGIIAAPNLQLGAGEQPRDSGARSVSISFQGRIREYLLHVPAQPNGSLVLAFHGGGQRAVQMQQATGLDVLADREHFILAYPQAFERSWADGRNETSAEKQGIDDVGFVKAVVADIARTYPVNRARVFATGLSNGGIFAHRLACEAADSVAAIAPVVAAIAGRVAESCHPSMPVAVVAVQGVADPSVHFDGGAVGDRPGGVLKSSRATEDLWRSLNGCAAPVRSVQLPTLVQDGTSVTQRSYAGCRGHGDVVWYEIDGGGHRWPPRLDGTNEALAGRENGLSSQNLDASEVIWAFFNAHARR